MDRVLALHAGRVRLPPGAHVRTGFFRSNRPGYPHPVSSELENSRIRVAVGDCSVTERLGDGVRLIKPAKLYICTQNTTNTTRTDARRRVCAATVPYRWATQGTSLRELEYTHTHFSFKSLNVMPFLPSLDSLYLGFWMINQDDCWMSVKWSE